MCCVMNLNDVVDLYAYNVIRMHFDVMVLRMHKSRDYCSSQWEDTISRSPCVLLNVT